MKNLKQKETKTEKTTSNKNIGGDIVEETKSKKPAPNNIIGGEDVEEIKKKKSSFEKLTYIGTVSLKELLFFTKNLAVMLKAGTTLTEALDVLKDQSKGKLKLVLEETTQYVEKGFRFSDGLAKYPRVFSEIYINVLKIGEESGTLEDNLDYLSDQLEKSYELRAKIVGAMIYPVIVIIGALVLGLGIILFVLPKITVLFKGFDVTLPLTTRMLIAVSDFFESTGFWSVLIILGVIIFFYWLLKQKFTKPITHWIILNTPIVKNISIHANLASFCRTMGILLQSGITIDEGVNICSRTVPNYHYQKFLQYTYEKIKAGDTLAGVLAEKKKMFSGPDVQIVRVGEESGTLSDSLQYCASIHEREVDGITKNLSNVLEPLLLVTVGLMVGFLALSIITPIYSITGEFRK